MFLFQYQNYSFQRATYYVTENSLIKRKWCRHRLLVHDSADFRTVVGRSVRLMFRHLYSRKGGGFRTSPNVRRLSLWAKHLHCAVPTDLVHCCCLNPWISSTRQIITFYNVVKTFEIAREDSTVVTQCALYIILHWISAIIQLAQFTILCESPADN